MSAINDFNKVWEQRFPGSELPPAWEEDVKNNLAKHKKRVQELHKELKEEEVYVQFLETLLEEVEKRKKESSSGDGVGKRGGNMENQEKDIADVIKNTVERRSHFSGDNNLLPGDGMEKVLGSNGKHSSDLQKDRSTHSLDSVGAADDLANVKTSDDSLSADLRGGGTEDDASGEDNTDDSKDHFVTVIEVNGFEKEKAAALAQSKSNGNSNEQMKRLKKVPPRPPPKVFKRPDGSVSSSALGARPVSQPAADERKNLFDKNEISSKSSGKDAVVDPKADRNVVFDSRGSGGTNSSTNGNNNDSNSHSSNSTMSSTSSNSKDSSAANNLNMFPRKAPTGKKFEGSKMPLPPTANNQVEKDPNKNHRKNSSSSLLSSQDIANNHVSPKSSSQTTSSNSNSSEKPQNNVRSKVFDLVSKMESGRAPPVPMKSTTNTNSNNEPLTPKRSFRKKIQDPLYCTAHDAVIADYMDPLDVDYDPVADQIYDCPPAESPEHVNNSLDRNKGSKTSTMESKTSDKSGGEAVDDTDNEPMYDTVAPDQVDDDYVVLLEEENQQQQSTSTNNSLSKADGSHQQRKRERENDYVNTSAISNDAAATIKSQTSVISGHSITTTTSSGTTSDTDGITGSPLPQDSHTESGKGSSNYVNIDYFLG